MKFQIGDKVLLLHSNEEGEVVDIINDEMVLVDVEGVSFPAYIDQLDFPYYKRFTEKRQADVRAEKKYIEDVKKENPESVQKSENGLWLTFLPVMETDEAGEDIVKEIKLHLLNQTKDTFCFIYELHFFGQPDFDLKNELHPFEDFYLHDILFEAMNDSPSFEFKFSLKQPQKDKEAYFETSFRLKPKQLFSKLNDLKEKNAASFSYRLFEKYPDKSLDNELYFPEMKKQKSYDLSKVKQHLGSPRSVIDLHIEKLLNDPNVMFPVPANQFSNNFEILSLQLHTFEKYYDLAVLHLQPSLIVIHGVGSGKLRDEIHKILKQKKDVKSFSNEYHPLYGYGATEIRFQY
ncbi:MAG: Smr/MutS family protein [Bacteroidetes bacterium]|nr:Smr/MutS family protein [Bacteroidota bacterium]MBS1930043.1 Smr/MutS family protein [Bacteroidota bacterium]